MKEVRADCDCCNLPKNINDGEWCEAIFVCNDCIFGPDYLNGQVLKIKNNK